MLVPQEIMTRAIAARLAGQKIVLVTGVFDIVHQEHITFLKKAKQLGFLVVGLESDSRVKEIKGPDRPINDQTYRKTNLEHQYIADGVFILPDQFGDPAQREALIAELRPDILAVSSHTEHQDRKQALLQKYGGQLMVVHEQNPGVSTTQILNQHPKAS